MTSCGEALVHKGKTYDCYGFIDKDEIKDERVIYKGYAGNIVMSVIFIETIIVPVYLLGYQTHCPVGVKDENTDS